jgi:hypothetical protein
MTNDSDIRHLRDEVTRLLAAALTREGDHHAEMSRRDEEHLAATERRDKLHAAEMGRRDDAHVLETNRRDELHVAELLRRDRLHVDELEMFAAALESRDTIGQAKGVIMATVHCSADEAFRLLKEQSQHENRKIADIAAEIADRAGRRSHSTG